MAVATSDQSADVKLPPRRPTRTPSEAVVLHLPDGLGTDSTKHDRGRPQRDRPRRESGVDEQAANQPRRRRLPTTPARPRRAMAPGAGAALNTLKETLSRPTYEERK